MNELLNDLWKEQRLLLLMSSAFLILTGVLMILLAFDSTQILGINRWIKPIKFTSSIAIYLFTLAIFLYYLPNFKTAKSIIADGAILMMVGEIFFIVLQAARGTTSHFNIAKGFDGMVFPIMGIMIFINTLLIIWLTVLYFRAEFNLSNAVVQGMRLGLIVFILGSLQGGYMSANMSHTVGASDGGAGLPFVNWSTIFGDLRVAHFFALHAFQIIPLVSLALVYLHEKISFVKPAAFIMIFAALYFSFITLTFAQALMGKPFITQVYTVTKTIEKRV